MLTWCDALLDHAWSAAPGARSSARSKVAAALSRGKRQSMAGCAASVRARNCSEVPDSECCNVCMKLTT